MKSRKEILREIEQIILDKIEMKCDCLPAKIVYQSTMAERIVELMEKSGWRREGE